MEENTVENKEAEMNTEKQTTQEPKKQKKLRGRKRLFADYQYVDVKKNNGKTVKRKRYVGKYYGFVIPAEYKKAESRFINRIKGFYTGVYLVILALWLVAVFVEPYGLGKQFKGVGTSAYVLIPHLAIALPLMLLFLTIVEFLFTSGNRHETAFAEALSKNMRWQTIMCMICAAISGVSEALFIILNYRAFKSPVTEFVLIGLMAAIVVVCRFWLKLQDSLPMEIKK